MRFGEFFNSRCSNFSCTLCSIKPNSFMNGIFWLIIVVPSLSGRKRPYMANACDVVDAEGSIFE